MPQFARTDYQSGFAGVGRSIGGAIESSAKTFSDYLESNLKVKDKKKYVRKVIAELEDRYEPKDYPQLWDNNTATSLFEKKFDPDKNPYVLTKDGLENFADSVSYLDEKRRFYDVKQDEWIKAGYKPRPLGAADLNPGDWSKDREFLDKNSKEWITSEGLKSVRRFTASLKKSNEEMTKEEIIGRISNYKPELLAVKGAYDVIDRMAEPKSAIEQRKMAERKQTEVERHNKAVEEIASSREDRLKASQALRDQYQKIKNQMTVGGMTASQATNAITSLKRFIVSTDGDVSDAILMGDKNREKDLKEEQKEAKELVSRLQKVLKEKPGFGENTEPKPAPPAETPAADPATQIRELAKADPTMKEKYKELRAKYGSDLAKILDEMKTSQTSAQ